jgi:branched-subunit amino acid transport protein
MTELTILATAGALTWALRASFLALAGGRELPPALHETIGSARHAVLGALVALAVAGPRGAEAFAAPSPQLVAAAVAGVVAFFTGGMLRTLLAGVATVALLGLVWP